MTEALWSNLIEPIGGSALPWNTRRPVPDVLTSLLSSHLELMDLHVGHVAIMVLFPAMGENVAACRGCDQQLPGKEARWNLWSLLRHASLCVCSYYRM